MEARQVEDTFKVGCVQSCTGKDRETNFELMALAIKRAVNMGARLVTLPETCNFMVSSREELVQMLCTESEDPFVVGMQALARDQGVHILLGSVAVHATGEGEACRAANRSLLINPDGLIAARYDKIHLFDVTLASGEVHAESRNYCAGSNAVVTDLPWGTLGMSVCYDVRFGRLYRRLAQAGADFITVPSAFTRPTGRAHWHVLLRARAIETGCFIIAPAQGGTHENGRQTYGHSLIVNPWGEILAEVANNTNIGDVEVIVADIKPSLVAQAREQIPSLRNGRGFTLDVSE